LDIREHSAKAGGFVIDTETQRGTPVYGKQ
jgi:hypothetical protein